MTCAMRKAREVVVVVVVVVVVCGWGGWGGEGAVCFGDSVHLVCLTGMLGVVCP